MNETEFIEAAAAVFEQIESKLDNGEVDCSINEGVMELEMEDDSKIIISRHLANREIWVAARSGGFHYRWQDGEWRDTRGGPTLLVKLSHCITAQGGGSVTF